MAELIPIEYRFRVAVRERIRLWALAGAVVLGLLAIVGSYSFFQEHRSATAVAALEDQYRARSSLIASSDVIKAKRQDLADRMGKIEELMDDRVLLALLHQIANGFSSNDCLEYINIDARGVTAQDSKNGAKADGDHYVVRLNGMTTNTTTLAELMTRLSGPAKFPVSVMLEKSNRENVLDGQVVRFQITCEKGNPPANMAG